MPQEQQNIRRWLVRLTGPIFIEMVLIILLGIVDTVMLSQCSDNTVAAVGVVVQLLNMIFLVFEATTAGTSVLCSQFLGARQMDNVFPVSYTHLSSDTNGVYRVQSCSSSSSVFRRMTSGYPATTGQL